MQMVCRTTAMTNLASTSSLASPLPRSMHRNVWLMSPTETGIMLSLRKATIARRDVERAAAHDAPPPPRRAAAKGACGEARASPHAKAHHGDTLHQPHGGSSVTSGHV